ncbi:MAG: DUF6958 family protein [Chitinophagaceae bacterium]
MTKTIKAKKTTTTHPRTGSQLKIDAEIYTHFKTAILQSLKGGKARLTGKNKEVRKGKTFSELAEDVKKIIRKKMPGFKKSIPWYTISIRLDLETKGEVETFIENGKKLNRIPQAPKGEK